MMKRFMAVLFLGALAQPAISLADQEDDIAAIKHDIDTIRLHTGGNPDHNAVLKQLQEDAAARKADDEAARAAEKDALKGVSQAEKDAIAKAEKDRKAAEKEAKENPYVIEVPEGTVMPNDALATYKAGKDTAKKAHDDARVTKLSTANTAASKRITTRSQAMQDSAKARDDAYQAALKKAVEEKRKIPPVPKFYN